MRKARNIAKNSGAAFAPTVPDLPDAEDAAALFAQAVSDVSPLLVRGRELAAPPKTANHNSGGTDFSACDLFSNKVDFFLEYSPEYLQGHVQGLDPLILGKLRGGSFSPEGHVDLHGQNLEQAYGTLVDFVREAWQSGKRHLLVITGRGKNSPGGTSILREQAQTWFTHDPFRRVVLAFCTARPRDGGSGALYLLLRKRNKKQGRIIWSKSDWPL